MWMSRVLGLRVKGLGIRDVLAARSADGGASPPAACLRGMLAFGGRSVAWLPASTLAVSADLGGDAVRFSGLPSSRRRDMPCTPLTSSGSVGATVAASIFSASLRISLVVAVCESIFVRSWPAAVVYSPFTVIVPRTTSQLCTSFCASFASEWQEKLQSTAGILELGGLVAHVLVEERVDGVQSLLRLQLLRAEHRQHAAVQDDASSAEADALRANPDEHRSVKHLLHAEGLGFRARV